MPIEPRPTARYFKGLPSDSEIPETKPTAERGALKSLPDWVRSAGAKPGEKEWEHLRDTAPALEGPQPDQGASSKDTPPKRVLSPFAVIADRRLRPRPRSQTRLEHDPEDPSSNARERSLALAERDGARNPFFKRETFEDVRATDSNLPNVSGAIGAIRAWHAKDVVTSAWVQQDKLVYDGNDDGVGGMDFVSASGRVPGADDESVPVKRLNSVEARALPPGSRVQIAVEDAEFSTRGIKGTLTPLPGIGGLVANFFADVGPYGQLELSSGVRGHVYGDVEAGFGPLVSVRIGVRRQKSEKDWAVKGGIGLHIDDSIIEYAAKSAKDEVRRAAKAAEKGRDPEGIISRLTRALSAGTEDELETMQDRAELVERAVSPQIRTFNRHAKALMGGYHERDIGDHLTLYDMTFDLSKPGAAAAFDRMFDARGEYRTIDIGLLEQLAQDEREGIAVHDNRVRTATRRSASKLFNVFGWGIDWGNTVENATVETGGEQDGVTINDRKHARHREVSTPRSQSRSVAEGRVRTVTQHEDGTKDTGISLDWSYSLEDRSLRADTFAGLLTFGVVAKGCDDSRARLERHCETLGGLVRSRVLGLPIGPKQKGKTESKIRVKLRPAAIEQLLESVRDPAKLDTLWQTFAEAHRLQHDLDDAPLWPIEGLNDDSLLALVRRKLPLSAETKAFATARKSVELLRRASDQEDPAKASEQIAGAFHLLANQLPLAAALARTATEGLPKDASEISIDIEGENVTLPESDEKPVAGAEGEDLGEILNPPPEQAAAQLERDEPERASAARTPPP